MLEKISEEYYCLNTTIAVMWDAWQCDNLRVNLQTEKNRVCHIFGKTVDTLFIDESKKRRAQFGPEKERADFIEYEDLPKVLDLLHYIN